MSRAQLQSAQTSESVWSPQETVPRGDLLRVPLLGTFLKWRYSRRALQCCALAIALVMIGHAFFGPEMAPKNLSVLLTWVHFRGVVVCVLLLAGNLFCMGCPFLLPRDLIRKWISPKFTWPKMLRNKWPAIVLFVTVLFTYELWDLWSNPFLTGVLIVAYFALATLIDSLFKQASFCKFVCPIGQFNFLSSAMSPLEVKVRSTDICSSCKTKDCIRGVHETANNSASRQSRVTSSETQNPALPQLAVVQRGCELGLYQPRKVDNLDCTFCLDCVYACPHDNVGLLPRMPADDLAIDRSQSGLGHVGKRTDMSVLIVVFTFGALLNAFAMISPVYALEQWIANLFSLRVEWPILSSIFVFALILEPAILLGSAAWLSRKAASSNETLLSKINEFSRSLIPMGFGIWLAHYGFHFFTGFLTVIPVTQNAIKELTGQYLFGDPMWQLGGLPERFVYPLELGFMGLGLLGSLLVTWRIANKQSSDNHVLIALPWFVLHFALFLSALWIMSQPMDMRGTFLGG